MSAYCGSGDALRAPDGAYRLGHRHPRPPPAVGALQRHTRPRAASTAVEREPAMPPPPPPASPPLPQRTPGTSDLRLFTTTPLAHGRHRVQPGRSRLRVVRNEVTGAVVLRPVLTGLGPQ
jgi:hypothetical protein